MPDSKLLVGVTVLYKSSIEESSTMNTLNKSLERIRKRLMLLVYDNGPEKQYTQECFEFGNLDIQYIHDPKNPGISKAYNEGIKYATKNGADWILLFDQDTVCSPDFLEMYFELRAENLATDIVCIIPKVHSVHDNTLFSPSKIYPGGITKPANRIKPGIIEIPITSINSGTFISVRFILSIGGFSNEYPLDMLDHWYFREIKRKKKKVLLLKASIHHDLSVNSFYDDVSIIRYESMLLGEKKFFRSHILDLCIYKFRLVFRIIKQLKVGQKEYAKLTLKYLGR